MSRSARPLARSGGQAARGDPAAGARTPAAPTRGPRPPLARKGEKPARGRIQQEHRAARLPPGKQPPAGRGAGGGARRRRRRREGAGGRAAPGPPPAHKVTARRRRRRRRPGRDQSGKFNFQRLRQSPRRGGARRPRGPPHPHRAAGPRPATPAPGHSLQPPMPGGESRLAPRRAALQPCHTHTHTHTQRQWRPLKNGAPQPEKRDIFLPLTELFPTSGLPTRYSSHSGALRDPPPPPPHPIAFSPPSPSAASPAVPPPLRFKMAPSALRRLLQSNRRGQHPGAGRARHGCAAPPADQTAPRAPALRAPPRPVCARARPSSAPPRPRARSHTGTPPRGP
ncbi:basic proline-rich protein-like [Symphalangus syndactylus]|uniref:basic proline-rich protein-like n=1 Tax=Symphalangus syndactylus TaxID=9590 RepID=UPI003005710D